jgi:hypothetical protein
MVQVGTSSGRRGLNKESLLYRSPLRKNLSSPFSSPAFHLQLFFRDTRRETTRFKGSHEPGGRPVTLSQGAALLVSLLVSQNQSWR